MEKEGVEWKRVEEKTRISFGLDLKTIFWQGYQKCNKQPSKLWVARSIRAGRTIHQDVVQSFLNSFLPS